MADPVCPKCRDSGFSQISYEHGDTVCDCDCREAQLARLQIKLAMDQEFMLYVAMMHSLLPVLRDLPDGAFNDTP